MNIRVLHEYKAKGLVKVQRHPRHDLFIWNYTDVVQVKNLWDDVTSRARALVTDESGHIIAHSFRKFHNIEAGLYTPTPKFTVHEKMDGSLILLFKYKDEWIISSRGSFTSEQARAAQNMLSEKYASATHVLPDTYTYCFEVIYPGNRIVVDYGNRAELVFLAAFRTDGTEAMDPSVTTAIMDVGFGIAREYQCTDYKSLKALNTANAEGFVVRFENGDRIKIKFEDYLRLHRITTNLDTMRVWETFATKKTLEEALTGNKIPDEFHAWYREEWGALQSKYDAIYNLCRGVFLKITDCAVHRKEFALAIKRAVAENPQVPEKILFHMFDQQDDRVADVIIKMVRPTSPCMPSTRSGKMLRLPPKIIILIGPSASGKSSWAKEYIASQPEVDRVVRVNRDTIRQQLFGMTRAEYYAADKTVLSFRERIVTTIEIAQMRAMLGGGTSVVVDNTNLAREYIMTYINEFALDYAIEYKLFTDVDVDTCIQRNAARSDQERVDEAVIVRQFKNMEKLLSGGKLTLEPSDPKATHAIVSVPLLPRCYVFDIDGTIADNSHRDPFDFTAVSRDVVIQPVVETLRSHHAQGYRIVLCSGRSRICEAATRDWLSTNNIPFHELYMRPEKNQSKDWVVKEAMWRDIATKYNIVALYDDRDSVVRHARRLGLQVFQVNEGAF